jgi:hypothetical protein
MLLLQTETLHPLPTMVVAPDWRVMALDEYRRAEQHDNAALRADLIARVGALTGVMLAADQVFAERATRQASATVDGVRFQLRAGRLTLVRPCEVCGVGVCTSPAIRSQADLGYALEAWVPRCPTCGPDADEDWSFSW